MDILDLALCAGDHYQCAQWFLRAGFQVCKQYLAQILRVGFDVCGRAPYGAVEDWDCSLVYLVLVHDALLTPWCGLSFHFPSGMAELIQRKN
jgi:hypothetical protein